MQSWLDTREDFKEGMAQAALDARTGEPPGLPQGIQASLVDAGVRTFSLCAPLGHEGSFSTAFFATITSASRQTLVLTVMEKVKRKENIGASARVAYLARRVADYGIHTGPVSVDMRAVRPVAR